jgi:DNA-binding SARP family transcriptional activator
MAVAAYERTWDGTPDRPIATPTSMIRLGLLRGFDVHDGDHVLRLPLSAQRLVAFLALHDRPLQRLFVAGSLWIDASERHANASLRTALWRLGEPGCRLVQATATHLALGAGVEVDVREARLAAEAVIRGDGVGQATGLLHRAGELLPDWYDDWVAIERETFRQLRLHALERLCETLTDRGAYAEATRAGLAAVEGEPLRESAHRALIKTYLAEGNPGEALRQFQFFRRLLDEQLGLRPSPQMLRLLEPLPMA